MLAIDRCENMSQEKFLPQGSDDNLIWNLMKYGLPVAVVTGIVIYFLSNKKITALENENQELKKENASLISTEKNQQSQIENLKLEIIGLKKLNTQYLEQIDTLQKSSETQIQESSKLIEKNNTLQTDNNQLSEKLEQQAKTYQNQIDSLESNNKTLKTKNIELQTQIANLQGNMETEKLKTTNLQEKINTLEKSNTALVEQSEENFQLLSQQLSTLEQQKASLISIKSEMEELKNSTTSLLEEQTSAHQKEKTELETQNAQLLKEIEIQKNHNLELKQENSKQSITINALQEQNLKLTQKTEEYQTQIKQSEEKIALISKEIENNHLIGNKENGFKTRISQPPQPHSAIKNNPNSFHSSPRKSLGSAVKQTSLQLAGEKLKLVIKLVEAHNNLNASEQEKLLSKLLIFQILLHKNDKTIKQIIADVKLTITQKLTTQENQLFLIAVKNFAVVDSFKDIEDNITKELLSLSETANFRDELESGKNLPQDMTAKSFFAILYDKTNNSDFKPQMDITEDNYIERFLLKTKLNLNSNSTQNSLNSYK